MADFDWEKDSAPVQGGSFDWERDSAAAPQPSGVTGRLGAVVDAVPDVTRLALQGATKRFSDEAQGWLESTFPRLGLTPGEFFDPRVPTPEKRTYAQARDDARATIEQSRQSLPSGVGTAAEVAGDIATDVASGGLSNTYKGAAAVGALSGLGASTADLTKGDVGGAVGDTLTGGAFGLAGKAVGDVIGSGYDRARNWVIQRAQRGQAAAGELAKAQAKDLVAKNVQQARSAAGSAASNARNIIENIEGIDIPINNPGRTVGQAKSAVLDQIDALDDALENAMAKAKAMGVEIGPSPGREGEFLAKGGRLDKAQKAAKSIQALQAARKARLAEYKGLLGRADDELVEMDVAALQQARNSLRSDPRFEDLKANVLKNSLNDFDRVSADALAKREAYRQAMAQAPAEEVEVAEQLLSGGEAMNQVKQRVQRYAAPLAGSLLGGGVGAGVGLAVGNDPTDAILYGLGGAGARPALAAVRRMAGHPAVQNTAWTSIETLAQTAPQVFGKYAGAVTSALARGPEALRALDKVLRDTDPEWRQFRQQQQGSADSR